jgi:hypothetical protein
VPTSIVSDAELTASTTQGRRISIAIATYNGERFLEAQLASIAHQSLLPTEVIVADDNSQDGTLEVVRRFATRAPFEMHIVQHARNIGVIENFYSAFDACRGELIFYCDQDDVWHVNKVEQLAAALISPTLMLAMHQSEIVDENLNSTHVIAPGNPTYGSFALPADSTSLFGFGHQMAFRREVLTLMQRLRRIIAAKFYPHLAYNFDEFIPFCASLLGGIAVLPEPLVQFRRHSRATSDAGLNLSTSKGGRSLDQSVARASYAIRQDVERATVRLAVVQEAAAQGLIDHETAERVCAPLRHKLRVAKIQQALLNDCSLPQQIALVSSAMMRGLRGSGFSNDRRMRALGLTMLAGISKVRRATTGT